VTRRLDQLLGEDVRAAELRAAQAFDAAAAPFGNRIVIYGAGNLGRRMLHGLRVNGGDALAFADRNAAPSRSMEGVPVLAPEDAVRRFGADALFVIAVWNHLVPGGLHGIATQLTAMGCRSVVPFVWLSWKYPREFLPNYLWDLPARVLEVREDVCRAFSLFEGERSQAEFLRQLEFRLTGNFACLTTPENEPTYFPRRLFGPRPDEYFVDCGAYTGDTLLAFADWAGGRFRAAMALEADPANFTALERTVAADNRLRGRVRAVARAAFREKGTLRFAASGWGNAAISEAGGIEVPCSALDDLLETESPTYIKMDVEAAEPDALAGAARLLRRSRPALAICAYHLQDHLWRIPLLIRDLLPDSRLALRMYCVDGFDLVCYAIPNGREVDWSEEDAGPREAGAADPPAEAPSAAAPHPAQPPDGTMGGA
jgi:FkbM family methyltransferase